MKILPRIIESCPIKKECDHNVIFFTFVTFLAASALLLNCAPMEGSSDSQS